MLQFAVDLGNSRLKAAAFLNGELLSSVNLSHLVLSPGTEQSILKDFFIRQSGLYTGPSGLLPSLIFSSVIAEPAGFILWLGKYARPVKFDHTLKVPFINLYATPLSLGTDRLAAVAGGISLYPGTDLLIISAGTAITYEFINRNSEYLGGSISPGIQMRYRALHTFTSRLPLVESDENLPVLTGSDTISALRSGVQLNTLFEMRGVILAYRESYGEKLRICVCGGDSKTFVTQLKSSIFADLPDWQPDLILVGLNKILTFNNA